MAQWQPIPLSTNSNIVKNYHRQKSLEVLRSIFNSQGKLMLGKQIGTASSFGKVYLLSDDNKYVLKEMDISTPSLRRIFENEVTIGATPGIIAVGPKIYAFLISPNGKKGAYIMDNFMKGHEGFSMSLAQYAREHWRNSCPLSSDLVIQDLKKKLSLFYRITKGYHGDLHSDNIQVIFDSQGKFKRVMIFDYGAHKLFKTNVSGKCFENIMNTIEKEFKNSYNKKFAMARTMSHPNNSVPMVLPKGQPFRSNANLFKRLNYREPWKTLAPGQKSLYNALYNKPKWFQKFGSWLWLQ